MADWNSELYLKFKAERTQPAHDLADGVAAEGAGAGKMLLRADETGRR